MVSKQKKGVALRIRAETSVGLFVLIAIVIFLYMTFQIGVLRLDRSRYYDYTVYFYDVSGLGKKADVQIAGVKVGWVEDVELVNNGQQVRASVKLLKDYVLYNDAYGLIRQDGLLGTKYLEIIPGDPLLNAIKPGGVLMKPSKEPVAVDAILTEFQDIARNLSDITSALRNVLGGEIGTQRIERAVDGFNQATENFSAASSSFNSLIDRNELAFEDMLHDLRCFSRDLKEEFPSLSHDIRDAVDRFARQFEHASEPVAEIAGKINRGEGILGMLVADDDMSRDVRIAIDGLKDYFETIDRLAVIFDSHVESMYGFGNKMDFRDAKGYFNVRLHPTEDYFYLLGVMGSYSGKVVRTYTQREWFDNRCKELIPTEMVLEDKDRLRFAPIKSKQVRWFDQWLWNAQFGKVYENLAFRLGLFEGTFGAAIDYDIPFEIPTFRWVTTLEAFDFYGRNRLDDTRMHLKWLNKLFFTESLYFVFGADDFISHTNRNAFFGAGFRFADDDVKYYVSSLSIA